MFYLPRGSILLVCRQFHGNADWSWVNLEGPNGCSLREPLSPTFQEVVRNFRGPNILVYIIKAGLASPYYFFPLAHWLISRCVSIYAGTRLPPDLTILHEHSDHFSLQCTRPMALNGLSSTSASTWRVVVDSIAVDLNSRLTEFINKEGRAIDRDQFDAEFPFTP